MPELLEWILKYWLGWLFSGMTIGISAGLRLIWNKQKKQMELQAEVAKKQLELQAEVAKAQQQEQAEIAKQQAKKLIALEEGLKGLLHDRIHEMYNKCLAKKFVTIAELDNLKFIYDPYAALDGNSTGQHMYEVMNNMPNSPPDDR